MEIVIIAKLHVFLRESGGGGIVVLSAAAFEGHRNVQVIYEMSYLAPHCNI